MAVRTYIDSGVLISALRGEKDIAGIALSFLNDPLREYVTSDYMKVELLPKCIDVPGVWCQMKGDSSHHSFWL